MHFLFLASVLYTINSPSFAANDIGDVYIASLVAPTEDDDPNDPNKLLWLKAVGGQPSLKPDLVPLEEESETPGSQADTESIISIAQLPR